jgi:hypothetical protein
MSVEFDEDLQPVLESNGKDVQIHSRFLPANEIRKRYLKRGFGNSYDFNQVDRLEELF